MEIAYGEQIKRNIDSGDLDEVANIISQWELYTNELEKDIQDKVAMLGMMQDQLQAFEKFTSSINEEMEDNEYSRNKKNKGSRMI